MSRIDLILFPVVNYKFAVISLGVKKKRGGVESMKKLAIIR